MLMKTVILQVGNSNKISCLIEEEEVERRRNPVEWGEVKRKIRERENEITVMKRDDIQIVRRYIWISTMEEGGMKNE